MCVFYGHTLRLINIDSELSLLAESQVVSMEQTGQKSKEKTKKVHVHVYTPLLFYIFPFSAILNFSRILESP